MIHNTSPPACKFQDSHCMTRCKTLQNRDNEAGVYNEEQDYPTRGEKLDQSSKKGEKCLCKSQHVSPPTCKTGRDGHLALAFMLWALWVVVVFSRPFTRFHSPSVYIGFCVFLFSTFPRHFLELAKCSFSRGLGVSPLGPRRPSCHT